MATRRTTGISTFLVTVTTIAVSALSVTDAGAYTRYRDYSAAPQAVQACTGNFTFSGGNITYGGGSVISNVEVQPVFWPNGATAVDSTVQAWAQGYFETLVNSEYMDIFKEYSTVGQSGGTNQTIGHGTVLPPKTITPTSATGASIDDSQIGPEINDQITAGNLPKPTLDSGGNPNTLYVLFFAQGVTITQQSTKSCASGGFCGYHNAYQPTSGSATAGIIYAVIPDFSKDCADGCAAQCDTGTTTIIRGTVSHEMGESITDVSLGNATSWYDNNPQTGGEIGDLCASSNAALEDTLTVPGTSIGAQQQWSQKNGKCIMAPPGDDAGSTPPPATDAGAASSDAGAPSADASITHDSGSADSGGGLSDAGSGTGGHDAAFGGHDAGSNGGSDAGNANGADGGTGSSPDGGISNGNGNGSGGASKAGGCSMTQAETTGGFGTGAVLVGLALMGGARRKRRA